MKTILEINGTNYGSSGHIMLNIAKRARECGFNVYTSCKNSRVSKRFVYDKHIYIGIWLERVISDSLTFITGFRDHFNILGTYLFIRRIEQIKPDLIHLHVMHDAFINYNLLFRYIKKNNIPIVWTFHDCCAFTGQCPHFQIAKCNKWKTGCFNCPQIHEDPKSLFIDTTRYIWNWKRKLFTSIDNLTIVTPSKWLANIVSESFLNKNDVFVINNGIDLNIFRPTESNFREKYNLKNKKTILGVANQWAARKGLDDFIKLSKILPNNYQIVLVGTNDKIDKKLSDNIISIHKTYNQKELAQIYSAADIFFNPSKEENFPTVNIESIACGTPVITYNTGGSPEIIDENTGFVLASHDANEVAKQIIRICEEQPYTKEKCVAKSKQYDMSIAFDKYVELYKNILN